MLNLAIRRRTPPPSSLIGAFRVQLAGLDGQAQAAALFGAGDLALGLDDADECGGQGAPSGGGLVPFWSLPNCPIWAVSSSMRL